MTYIDVHIMDLAGCETDCALAQRDDSKVLMVDLHVTLERYDAILGEMLTDAERANAVYHGLSCHVYQMTA